jgi:hypothetical protein
MPSLKHNLTFYSIYTHFIACASSADQNHGSSMPSDQDLHCLFLARNNEINQKANSADADQTAQMFLLIRIYTVRSRHKGAMFEKVPKVSMPRTYMVITCLYSKHIHLPSCINLLCETMLFAFCYPIPVLCGTAGIT